jgi:hypothetical protein
MANHEETHEIIMSVIDAYMTHLHEDGYDFDSWHLAEDLTRAFEIKLKEESRYLWGVRGFAPEPQKLKALRIWQGTPSKGDYVWIEGQWRLVKQLLTLNEKTQWVLTYDGLARPCEITELWLSHDPTAPAPESTPS